MSKFIGIKNQHIISKQRNFETHVCKHPSFVSHQQHCVAGGGDSGVVVALVEGAGLIGGGFGRKGGDERQAVGRKQPVQTREELRVCLC